TRNIFLVMINQIFSFGRSASNRREGCADALGKFGLRSAVGRLCVLIDQRALSQFLERQRRVHASRVVEVTVDQPVEKMANVEPSLPPGGIRVTNDIDGAAVG